MNVLVYDTGLAVEHAISLAKAGHKVRYYTPWNSNFPSFLDYAPGLGIPGLEKVLYFFENVDWADVVVFFDTGAGDLTTYLRKKGKPCFGAGLHGEKLENHRYLARWLQDKNWNLPTQETVRIEGTQRLRDYLKTHKNVVVKHDIFRGDLETIYAKDLASVEQLIDDVEAKLGPFRDTAFFTVEEALDGIEPGFDCFFGKQGFMKPFLWGYESNHAYIGKMVDELPPDLAVLADKMGPYLSNIDYRGAVSVEAILTKDGGPFLIDGTFRMPFPLSLLYTELYSNYADIIVNMANGEPVTPKATGSYVACLPLFSEYARDHWLAINVEPKERKWVKTLNSCQVGDRLFTTRGPSNVVNLVAVGDSVEAVVRSIERTLGGVHAHGLDGKVALGSLTNIQGIIEKGEKEYGLDFGSTVATK